MSIVPILLHIIATLDVTCNPFICNPCDSYMVILWNSFPYCSFFSSSLISTGCLLAFVSNDRITDTVDSFQSTPIAVLDTADDYFNQTLHVSRKN